MQKTMRIFGKDKNASIPRNLIDVHSHILPGIDDGSRNMEQSLNMLKIAAEEGIGTVIATPHNMPGKGKASRGKVLEFIEDLQRRSQREGLPVNLLPGCELFYREEAKELLEREKILTLNGSGCVLVEFDVLAEKQYIVNAVREILCLGFTPVAAHVERYASLMQKDFFGIEELRRLGCLIQVNADSVAGNPGSALKKQIKRLLKEQLVDFIGTDAHSDGRRAPRMQECIAMLQKWCPSSYVKALVCENAKEYLEI